LIICHKAALALLVAPVQAKMLGGADDPAFRAEQPQKLVTNGTFHLASSAHAVFAPGQSHNR
jgi:hypothetical protein